MVAGAYDKAGYEVILTPRSGDYGRDVIAIRRGVGSIRILGSVKAFKPNHLVTHEAVRSLLGVVSADQKASKGILTTTSDFAPTIITDPLIAPHLPTRIELMNGTDLQNWLADLSGGLLHLAT
jgi:restriction system protein